MMYSALSAIFADSLIAFWAEKSGRNGSISENGLQPDRHFLKLIWGELP